MTDRVWVPTGADAPPEAVAEVAELSMLFADEALSTRRRIIREAMPHGTILDGSSPVGQRVGRSMTWGTAVEVGLQLCASALDAQRLALLDAATTCLRISRGLAERVAFRDHTLVDALSGAGESILSSAGVQPAVYARHAGGLHVLRNRRVSDGPWDEADVRTVVDSTPTALAFEALGSISDGQVLDAVRIATDFGPTRYLSEDLAVVGKADQMDDGLVSPVRSALADTAPGADATACTRSAVQTVLRQLDLHASRLDESVRRSVGDETVPQLFREYAANAVVAAALSYQIASANGYSF